MQTAKISVYNFGLVALIRDTQIKRERVEWLQRVFYFALLNKLFTVVAQQEVIKRFSLKIKKTLLKN
tara:strand:+ start:266 stop:466 length:201 start_codon:yes stop_codon:yes gene_type:complete